MGPIDRISAAIEQIGYKPAGVGGTSEEEIQKFAQENGLSVDEAREVLKTAQEKAEENDRIMSQESALMAELLNDQDEEEIEIVDDADFDSFLNQESPEQQMQKLLNQQLFAQPTSQQNPTSLDDALKQSDNPFLNMKW